MGNYSRFTWSLDVTTGSWTQLATAPKKHYPGPQGGYFYQDGDVLRDAKDNTLNYDVSRDVWVNDPKRVPIKDHDLAPNPVVMMLPF